MNWLVAIQSFITAIGDALAAIIPYMIRISILFMFLLAIKLLSWPDITPYLTFLQDGINKLYFLNAIMDMNTAFTLIKWVLAIELAYLSYRILRLIVTYVASGSFGGETGENNPDDYD